VPQNRYGRGREEKILPLLGLELRPHGQSLIPSTLSRLLMCHMYALILNLFEIKVTTADYIFSGKAKKKEGGGLVPPKP
jgi:hypothetical protein